MARCSKYVVDPRALLARLDEARAEQGLSRRQLGKEIGVPSSVFCRMQNGKGLSADSVVSMLVWLRWLEDDPEVVKERVAQ